MTMYKYCIFDEYSLDNLAKKQLWCNHYEAFNDPFECWCIEKTGIPDPNEEWDRFNQIAKTWGFASGLEVSKTDLQEYCSEFIHSHSMRVSHYSDSARITCFSKQPDNLLMWSHYANGFRGYCIEFDENLLTENSSNYAQVHEVIYAKHPPVVDTMVYEVTKDQVWYHEMAIHEEETSRKYLKSYSQDKLLPKYHKALSNARALLYKLYKNILCYKPLVWEYEEESRLILHTESKDKHGKPFSYPLKAIKRVIVGEKASHNNVKKIRDILSKIDADIPIKTASRCPDEYKVLVY